MWKVFSHYRSNFVMPKHLGIAELKKQVIFGTTEEQIKKFQP